MLNIVVPMAGLGSRFTKAGYTTPKPLILIHDIPMIQIVIENLTPQVPHHFIFICQKQHIEDYELDKKLYAVAPKATLIELNEHTLGAACTVLKAKSLIDNDKPLMIANCDQYIDTPIDDYLNIMLVQNLDGLIMTLKAEDPKWSYVGLNENNLVERVVEKKVISQNATVGIYNFKHGSDFVWAAEKMIHDNQNVNGEFYVAPAYNELIAKGLRIGTHCIGKEMLGMYGLGTPADLEFFLSLPLSHQLIRRKKTCAS